ncbi:glycosyltransferase family 2 protein [Candidatus Dojkabacteria bacterium]|nr:glycosyltransferase family 2 protein [Candidatus Dojkabacteria bacterium]
MNTDRLFFLLFRVFKRIPGYLMGGSIVATILIAVFYPDKIVFISMILATVLLVRSATYILGLLRGFFLYKRESKIDWEKKLLSMPESDKLTHVILIPFYKEGINILGPTLDALAASKYDLSKVFVVLGVEERAGNSAVVLARKLCKEYGKIFKKVTYYIHPANIDGEVVGAAGANRTWACKQFVLEFANKDSENYLLTTFDCDLRVDPSFFAALTCKYLANKDRNNCFFAPAVYLYSNNIEDVPFFVRLKGRSTSLGCLSNWGLGKRWATTFSVYSANLAMVIKNDYWDPSIGIDDTPFFWRAYARLGVEFKGCPIFLPVHSNAVKSSGIIATGSALYRQQLRWGWGVVSIPVFFSELSKKISLPTLVIGCCRLFSVYWLLLFLTFYFLLFLPAFGFIERSILLAIFNQGFGSISIVGTIFILVSTIVSGFLYKPYGIISVKGILNFLMEVLGSYFTAILFFFIPFVHAQFEMMVKSDVRKEYYVSEK